MARGERVIAISHFVADHAASVYGVGPDRLRTIPRGVDLDVFDPTRVGAHRIINLAREWRLPDGAPVVMLPGRLTRWKGGLDFIAAIAATGLRDICCLLVGSEQHRGFRRELETAIERQGLSGLFRIAEDCRDMPAAYMLADVVVSASRDPATLAMGICEALSLSPGERERFARRAITHVAAHFSREAMCARTIEVYEELLFPRSIQIDAAA
jgi:glycosyltransferase involved in cell wall biosynthesis